MTTRLKDSVRTRLIAEFIRTGIQPEGYIITINDSSKYKVRKVKSPQEILQAKKDRLKKQLEATENELKSLSEEPVQQQDEQKNDSKE